MGTEKGIITAVTYNRNRTVAKLRIGVKKWAYVRTTLDVSALLGGNGVFTGEWKGTIKRKYFLVSSMEIGQHPAPEKVMEKVLRLIAKEGVKISPLWLKYDQLLLKTLTTLFLMGRKRAIVKFLRLPEHNQDKYLSNPYMFYLQKRLDYYSAETLSSVTCCPLDMDSRIIAHAQHAVTLFYEDGRECVPIKEVAATLANRINIPEADILPTLDTLTARGSCGGVRRSQDNLMLDWIYWLREKSIKMMFDNPIIAPPECAEDDEDLSRLLSRRLCVLTGRAGTGKTTLLKRLRETGLRITFAALTGKAANLLGEDSRTVHNLLGYRGGKFTVDQLDCDLLVVDEASMCSWHTLYAILKAAPRVIFAGDPAQLPPVEGEAVFHRVISMLPLIELTKAWRFTGSDGPNIEESLFSDDRALLTATARMASVLSKQGSIQVITPVNTGPLGVGNLNTLLRPVMNQSKSEPLVGVYRMGDRVMCCRNVYCDGEIIAANGQTGIVSGRENGMLWVTISGNPVLLEANALTFAYAQTVHKCQGDQFDNVIFIVPGGLDREFLTENLLLVGKTRGREKTYVFKTGDCESSVSTQQQAV
jgi:hypothetical protein